MAGKRRQRAWAAANVPSVARSNAPETLKARVQPEADRLVAEVLAPAYLRTEPEDWRFGFVAGLSTLWFRGYLYFCAEMARADDPERWEVRFARMEYAGDERFHLAYMRHTGEWCTVYHDLPWREALSTIADEAIFHP